MSDVKIKTLTAVHIGNGNLLKKNMDYVVYKDQDGDSRVGIINPRKVLSLIGVDHLNDWLLAIDRNDDIQKFVARYHKKAMIEDYQLRSLTNYAPEENLNTLKECLHNGVGLPYIPGSSIKGAIRTAVLATVAKKVGKSLNTKMFDQKGKASAKGVESFLFGTNVNKDLFRFLQVGDAYFDKGCEVCYLMTNLNIRKDSSLRDDSKFQAIEAISLDYESSFKIKIAQEQYQLAKSKGELSVAFPEGMESLTTLFELINEHSLNLVKDEIAYWKSIDKEGAEEYVESMKTILEEIESCDIGKECVLRIGHASGWRFITGAWTEMFRTDDWKINPENVFYKIVSNSRPKAQLYREYDFPKSRRLDIEGYLLGFVKLSIK